MKITSQNISLTGGKKVINLFNYNFNNIFIMFCYWQSIKYENYLIIQTLLYYTNFPQGLNVIPRHSEGNEKAIQAKY